MADRTNSHNEQHQPENFRALIDTLRKEAVGEADKKATEIIADAEKRAAAILGKAQLAAEESTRRERLTAEQFEAASRTALVQASRDTLLSLEQAIRQLLDAIVLRETRKALGDGNLLPVLQQLLEKWQPEISGAGIEILLNEEQARHLEETSWQKLQIELGDGVVLKPVEDLEPGIRIGVKGGHVHYDFTAETVAQWMTKYLKPRLAEILREAIGEPGDDHEAALETQNDSKAPGTK